MELLDELAAGGRASRAGATRCSPGTKINITENRAVLHAALRDAARPAASWSTAHDVVPDVHAVLDAMAAFSDAVRSGAAPGATGKPITDVVNIGIGGSDLGPAMATLALAP